MKLIFSLLLSLISVSVYSYDVSTYNEVWTSQSENSSASMPLGAGDIGCNVWVENGDLLLYISRSGTFDENNSMLKLGRVRIHFDDNPFSSGFRQELHLENGTIVVNGADLTVRLWVEVFRPVIHIETSGDKKRVADVAFEAWRLEDRQLSTRERHQCFGYSNTSPDNIPVITHPDTYISNKDCFIWYHKNRNDELATDREASQQHLDGIRDRLWSPLRNLIFGGCLVGDNMMFTGTTEGEYAFTPFRAWHYVSKKAQTKQNVTIELLTTKDGDEEAFVKKFNIKPKTAKPQNLKTAYSKNLAWWKDFWNRSYIYVDMDHPGSEAYTLGRLYAIFRYQLACNAYGEWPTKFNGSLFTYDPMYERPEYKGAATPDFRLWGGGSFTGQNQRLVYWPMLKSGDFDMMAPQFDFYLNALPNSLLTTRYYYGHGGSSFSEQLNNNGLPSGHSYQKAWGGTKMPIQPRSDAASTRHLINLNGDTIPALDLGWITNLWIEDHYDTQLEFGKMILDYYEYSGADISRYIPLIDAGIRFHDEHFQYWSRLLNGKPLGDDGKLIMYPGAALETYKRATNASCTIAGMRSVINELLDHPSLGTSAQRQYWKEVLQRLPDMPFREREGHKTISPAKTWHGKAINNEMPQLYPVFPYRLYGVGRPDIQVAIDTYLYGADRIQQRATPRSTWHPDAIYAADLGLTEEAAKYVKYKFYNSKQSRFPTFWGTGDWGPDHNWGGVGMIALQEMLLQVAADHQSADSEKATDDDIFLLPAWPKEWDVDFKLHAPGNRVVTLSLRNGKIINKSIIKP